MHKREGRLVSTGVSGDGALSPPHYFDSNYNESSYLKPDGSEDGDPCPLRSRSRGSAPSIALRSCSRYRASVIYFWCSFNGRRRPSTKISTRRRTLACQPEPDRACSTCRRGAAKEIFGTDVGAVSRQRQPRGPAGRRPLWPAVPMNRRRVPRGRVPPALSAAAMPFLVATKTRYRSAASDAAPRPARSHP